MQLIQSSALILMKITTRNYQMNMICDPILRRTMLILNQIFPHKQMSYASLHKLLSGESIDDMNYVVLLEKNICTTYESIEMRIMFE